VEVRRPSPLAICATILLLTAAALPAASGRDRVSVLYHGDALETDRTSLLLVSDPMLDVTRVPSHAWRSDYDPKIIKRFLRLYMPRSYENFAEYDLLILSDASRDIFTAKELTWFHRGTTESGVSLAMMGGYDSFGGSHGALGWSGTTVEEILPVTLIARDTGNVEVRMSIEDETNPLMKNIQLMSPPPYMGMNIVETRTGAQLLSTGIYLRGKNPLMVYWDLGEARSFALTADWNGGWGTNFLNWPDYPTYASLITYFASRIELPEDLATYGVLRSLFFEYPTRRGLVTSLLEFVEKFGVSSPKVLDRIGEVDRLKLEAEELFLSQEYEEALLSMEDINDQFIAMSADLVSLKERALMWVYIIEWLVVSATAMVCGTLVWTLMVRRRLYREVGTTRPQLRA
jgi:uncharacterized membrane protein